MVGNWSKGAYGQKLYETYRGHGNIHLLDPVYDQKKLNELERTITETTEHWERSASELEELMTAYNALHED